MGSPSSLVWARSATGTTWKPDPLSSLKDVADQVGVTVSTIWNWEHGWNVDQRYLPRIITFLGYNPIPCPEGPLERLAWYKQVNGLTLKELGAEMGRDPEQLAHWLGGRHKPCRRNRKMIELFLRESLRNGRPR